MRAQGVEVHEIGHAAAGIAMGAAVQYVVAHADGSGSCQLTWPANHDWYAPLVVTLAGVVGERLLLGPRDWPAHELMRARSWVAGMRGCADDEVQQLESSPEFAAAVREAEKIINAHKSAILEIAHELARVGRLDGATITARLLTRDPRVLRRRLDAIAR